VSAQNNLDFGHRNLGFGSGTSFLVKNNVNAKRGHIMKKFKRQIVDYEISDFCMLI
jgi:hypothetical protein